MNIVTLLSLLTILTNPQAAPNPQTATQLQEMKKLDFLIGEWKGEGWTEYAPGQRKTASIIEKVKPKLGGMILLVEGMGKTKVADTQEEKLVHSALGLLSYDAQAKQYRLRSYLIDGRSTDADAKFVGDGFQWSFKTPQGFSIRYTVNLTNKGEWFERGEMSQDGKTWRQFHEMTLQKVK